MAKKLENITFKYVYPDNLPDLYVNGLWGGTTPRKEIYVHFYSERLPIPKTIIHELGKNKTVGKPKSIEQGGDVVRLVQASLVLDVHTAIEFRDWLDRRIKFINKSKKIKGKNHGNRGME